MTELRPAPGQPGSDQLPFMAAFGNPDLVTCGHGDGCSRPRCTAERAQRHYERDLVNALRPDDIRWLNGHGWDGRLA